jgi:tRNA dimethylallyltransferase
VAFLFEWLQSPVVLIIVGPTGSGKSALAVAIAEATNAEIVSVDSQQVYRGMDIGTSKPSVSERALVPHHLLDIVDPDEEMTAYRFAELAHQAIAGIVARERPVILCGGTGLYERAIQFGLFEGPKSDPALRAELETLATEDLRRELERVDAPIAQKIESQDRRRMIRALEVFRLTGEPMSAHQARHDHRQVPPRYAARVVGLSPPRDILYAKIDARVDAMMERGLLNEVKTLRSKGYGASLRSQEAIGYSELHKHLTETLPLPLAVDTIKRNSRHYARRQLSWYRNDSRVSWFPSVEHALAGVLNP